MSFLFFEQNKELKQNKEKATAYFQAGEKLKEENEKIKKNLRQITVLGASTDSKNVKVGNIIYSHANNTTGDLSVYYKNLTTDEAVIVDGERKYYMASLYKVILTLYILDEIEKGSIDLSDKIGTGSATIEKAMEKIITESNNEYAQALGEDFGWKEIEKYMKQKLGIDFTFTNKLEITIKNLGILFEDIARALKVTDDESNYLLQLLKDQKKTSKLPKYLPKNIYSHNKTGEFEEFSHDAGIFYTPRGNYILIFMSKTKNPAATNEKMAIMSKEIFELLNNDR